MQVTLPYRTREHYVLPTGTNNKNFVKEKNVITLITNQFNQEDQVTFIVLFVFLILILIVICPFGTGKCCNTELLLQIFVFYFKTWTCYIVQVVLRLVIFLPRLLSVGMIGMCLHSAVYLCSVFSETRSCGLTQAGLELTSQLCIHFDCRHSFWFHIAMSCLHFVSLCFFFHLYKCKVSCSLLKNVYL